MFYETESYFRLLPNIRAWECFVQTCHRFRTFDTTIRSLCNFGTAPLDFISCHFILAGSTSAVSTVSTLNTLRFQNVPILVSLAQLPVTTIDNIQLLFSVEKKIFGKKIINSVVGFFFLFRKQPMTRRVQVCRVVGALYNTCVGCPCGFGAGGFEFR